MKIGTTVPVTIAGQQVTLATVKAFDPKTGHVTLEFPGTRAVMQTRTDIVQEERQQSSTEDTLLGVERQGATVDENPQIVENTTTPEAPVADNGTVANVLTDKESAAPVETPPEVTSE